MSWPALVGCLLLAAALFHVSRDVPSFGDPSAPIHGPVAERYLGQAGTETNVANTVTAVLASYRGHDTMFEVGVIFTAGAAVILLLRHREDRAEGLP